MKGLTLLKKQFFHKLENVPKRTYGKNQTWDLDDLSLAAATLCEEKIRRAIELARQEFIKDDICENCGADNGLHHYETDQCPLHGIEETRDNHPQRWGTTVYKAKIIKHTPDEIMQKLSEPQK